MSVFPVARKLLLTRGICIRSRRAEEYYFWTLGREEILAALAYAGLNTSWPEQKIRYQ
jgi:hypothetical protein